MREKVGVMKSLTTRMVKVGAMKQVGAMRSFKLKRISNHKARDTKGKKRLPDRGMEKRKHKVLHTRPQQAPFDEDMKTFVTQLFQQGFAAMEERLEKKMDEKFEGV
ncbi:hypothetical protein Bca52824_005128 [Brassica carinata]|uniref:Uncharacterized protein n=1 Tax=Brassica carinata TaxID=52824 RepID=A0A8X7WN80_BRACI|nr:hypothetical protein Bca52824_005128 [Brassica carinata]